MRLQGIHGGVVYASEGRIVFRRGRDGQFDRIGRLPSPADGLVRRTLSSSRWHPLTDRLIGAVTTVNVWPLSASNLLATVGRRLFTSADGGSSWEASIRLPASSGPMGVLPPAVAHRNGTTYLGEYPLDSATTPRVLASQDWGRTWTTDVSLPTVRHIHAVQVDPYTDDIWITTGDTDSESQIGRLRNGSVDRVGGGSQAWRAVELAFTPSSVLWGMDSVYVDDNRIYRLPRSAIGPSPPDIESVHTVDGSVYYGETLTDGTETWVVFSTAMEAGRDSTGPPAQSRPSGVGQVVAASSATAFAEWHEIASFRRKQCLGDYLPGGLPRANGYVFLGADPDRGLLVNPYNTATNHGEITLFPNSRLTGQSQRDPSQSAGVSA